MTAPFTSSGQWTRDVNRRFGLTGGAMLRPSIAGPPLIWFEGDLDRITSDQWVRLMLLNQPTARS